MISSYDVRKDVQNKCSFHITKCKICATCKHCVVLVSDGVAQPNSSFVSWWTRVS